MKEIKKFIEYEPKKTSKNVPYLRFKDDLGKWFSCFDKDVYQKVQYNLNKNIEVDFTEQGDFKNITSFVRVLEDNSPQDITPTTIKMSGKSTNDAGRVASMLLSYAKDLVVAGKGELDVCVKAIHSEYKKLKTQLEND